MTTSLYLLGRPRADIDGRTVELPAKAAALLGYLALSSDPQPRERVLGLLWGESAEDAARKNLRNTLWAIRRDLGAETVVTAGDRLALRPDLDVDARRLSAADPVASSLDAAVLLDHYAGPFLDGVTLSDAPDFELWLSSARDRLAQTLLARLTDAVVALNGTGEWRHAADLARRALALDPLHEGLTRGLMAALARLGERGEALRQYETLKASLERELGAPPAAETTALRNTIAADRPPAEAPGRAISVRPRRPLSSNALTQPETPFVGRRAERAMLDEEFARAAAGQARVVVLTGELGIGKSRLWREWRAGLPADCPALEARCVEAAGSLPFAPLVELFASHPCIQELLHPAASPAPLALPWLAEVSRLLPQLRAEVPGLPAPAVLPPEEERHRVFEAFVQVIVALDARPLVIFVDDAHWADRATLEWLPYLVHRLRSRPVLLMLAFRPEEAPAVLVHQVAAWGREGVLRRVPLGRLAPEETAALIAGLNVDVGVTHQLQGQSAGNPYFLLELSRNADALARGAVPAGLAELLAARIDRLSDDARSVLQAAGVLDPEFDLPLLTQCTSLVEDAVLDALDELLAARLLTERNGRFAFNHPLLSRVVRQSLNSARRMVLHRRAAQALEVSHTDALPRFAGLIGGHYAEAGDLPRAAAFLDIAAEHAASLAAFAEVVAFRRRASQLAPTPTRAFALGEALYRAGALAEARTTYLAALRDADAVGDQALAARICLRIGGTYLPAGWIEEVRQWAERSLTYLDAAADPWAHAQAHFLLGAGRLRAGGSALEEAEAELAEAVRLAELHHISEVAMVARFELGNARAERGDLPAAMRLYQETADLARAAREPNQQVLALNNLAYHGMLLGETTAARHHIEEAIALADQYGLGMAREYLLSTAGEIELADGRWAEAEARFNASQAAAETHNNVAHVAKCRANLGLVAQGRGDLDSALILLEEAADLAAPLTARYMQAQIDLWLTEVYLRRGEVSAAAGALNRAEVRLADSHYRELIKRSRALRARL